MEERGGGSYENPVCPCEQEEVLPQMSYKVPQPWITYTATPEDYLNKEDMARRLAELDKAEPGTAAAVEAAKLSYLYEEAAGFAASQADRAASRGDKVKALAESEEAVMLAIHCKTIADIAARSADIALAAKEKEKTPTTTHAYRTTAIFASDAAIAAQIAAHYANKSKEAVQSVISNLANVAEEAAGSASSDPAAIFEAVDEAMGSEEVAAKLPCESIEELAGQLEKVLLSKNE